MCVSLPLRLVTLYIYAAHRSPRARAPPRARTHTARTHAHSSLHTDTHTARVDTGQCSVQETYIYESKPTRPREFSIVPRVSPLWGTIYPSDMKVGNLLPACDWNMSSFLYRYNFRFWSFLLRSHWCAGALAAAPLWALCARVAPPLWFFARCPLVLPVARFGGARAVCRAGYTHTHIHTIRIDRVLVHQTPHHKKDTHSPTLHTCSMLR